MADADRQCNAQLTGPSRLNTWPIQGSQRGKKKFFLKGKSSPSITATCFGATKQNEEF